MAASGEFRWPPTGRFSWPPSAVALDTGELACSHERSFAKNRTITALEHARALRERHGEQDQERENEPLVEQRPLAVYDRLIA